MKSLVVKFLMTLAVLWLVLGWFYAVSFTDILILSLVITGIGYVADLYILPRAGNLFSSALDFGLALLIVWFLGSYLFEGPVPLATAAILSAIALTIGEMFFHRYMEGLRKSDDGEEMTLESQRGYYNRTDLQTEFGKEFDTEEAKNEARRNDTDY
ncbi:YndM family protein [Chungangia koreensis]|uniref:YndM family protein n=1 Tax=Chungangia koreensis TaxID=752657 RepID=A0ABV8X2H1_9LACT